MTKEEIFEQAVEAFGDDKLDEAIDLYRKALEIDPKYTDALHGLGMALSNRGRHDEAVDAAKRLIEIDNDDVLAHTSLSMFYMAQGRIEEAEKEGNVAKIMGWKQDLRKDQK
jgi:tetratricopeptide (TPR) repeat protein